MQTKIDRSNIEDIIPLTTMQEGMLFHYRMEPDSTQYHEQVSIGFVGAMDVGLLQKAWDFVIHKNEMLRTVFRWKGIDKPVQMILKSHQITIDFHDLSGEKNEEKLQIIKEADLEKRIDIEQETLRIALCRRGENEYTMIISNHHILFDGWSSGIIIKELINAYQALSKGLEPRVALKNKFSEYVKWIRSLDKIEQKKYWENYLDDAQQNDDLFSKGSLSAMKSYEYVLEEAIGDQMTAFAKEFGIPVATLLYTAWGVLAGRLNNTRDIIFGMTTSGRDHSIKGIENMVGLFINTIPLRIQVDEEETIFQLLRKVNEITKASREFASTSLVDINEYAGINHQSQLFNSLVVIENYPLNTDDYQDGILRVNHYSAIERTNYNLTIGITTGSTMTFKFAYNCFTDDQMIVRVAQYFETILSVMVMAKSSKVIDINFLSKDEQDKLLYEFNDTEVEYPQNKTIHQLFAAQVATAPDDIALVFADQRMTYRELNREANQLARILREGGVKANEIVGLMVDRSLAMLVGIMGILKSGGAYMPIDADLPEERIKFMLEDSKVKILLTQSWLDKKASFAGEKINLDQIILNANEVENVEYHCSPRDLAYVIYTSGSTGKPKGVMVEHRSVVNLCSDQISRFKLGNHDHVLKVPSISFDASVEQIFITLLSGATLYLVDKELLLNRSQLSLFLQEKGITHIAAIPSFFESLDLAKASSLKRIIFGGEACKVTLARKLSENFECYNEYGPTEATVTSTIYPINSQDVSDSIIPIGKPLANYKAYILSTDHHLAPIGVAGELCIAGDGLARGYWNRPDLTAAKFIENPFIAGERIYRTGDLARWLPDGNIEFLGRIDHQVKIRGFRIELGEIESQILKFSVVKEAVALVRENTVGDQYLCAYLISEAEISVIELREHLSGSLPDYMIPSYFVQLPQIPRTPSGKIDLQALPEPDARVTAEYVPPRNQMEETLAQIWSEVLGREKIGINDNFFELGGHSLKATALVSRIHKQLNVEIQLKEFFKKPTIAQLNHYLASADKSVYAEIEAVATKADYEASYTQKRMWVLNQLEPNSTMFNMVGRVVLLEKVEQMTVQKVFDKLFARHEAFRTRFAERDGVIVQLIAEKANLIVDEIDLITWSLAEKEQERKRIYQELSTTIFNLEAEPLIDIKLVKINEQEADLIFCMHHIIADGWSLDVLKREFFMLYEAYKDEKKLELHPLRIQYKDFAQWQNRLIASGEFSERAKAFWRSQLTGEIPTLNLPVDYGQKSVASREGSAFKVILAAEIKDKLKALALKSHTSLFVVMITTFITFLSELTEQDDLLIGLPTLGRGHEDLHGVIGCFVNTTIIRNKINHDAEFTRLLKDIGQNTLNALEYQNYPLELITDELKIKYPKIAVFFNMLNFGESANENVVGSHAEHIAKTQDVKFDWEWNVTEYLNGIEIICAYNKGLFKPETIEYIMSDYTDYVLKVSTDPDKLLEGYFADDERPLF